MIPALHAVQQVAPAPRSWQPAGAPGFVATLVRQAGESVVLAAPGGATRTIPLASLSSDDQRYCFNVRSVRTPFRTWHLEGATPRTFRAAFVRQVNQDRPFSEAIVVVIRDDFRRRSYPLKALSADDRAYVAAQKTPEPPADTSEYPMTWGVYDPVKDKDRVNVSPTAHFAFFYGNERKLAPDFLPRVQAHFEDVWRANARSGVKMPAPGHKLAVYISGTGLPKHRDGFAFGGESILMHPDALGDGSSVIAHEFTHVLQFYSGGFRGSELVGWFWECHGNWNAHQYQPGYAPALEVYDDRAHYELTSSRMNYGSWPFLQYLSEHPRFGPAVVQELWSAARPNEDPIQVIQRLGVKKGLFTGDGVEGFGDLMGEVAAHMVAWDFVHQLVYQRTIAGFARADRMPSRDRVILRPVPDRPGWFAPLYSHAPRCYGINRIDLAPEPGATEVSVDLHGIADEQIESNWRATLVAVDAQGECRYSPMVRSGKTRLALLPGDTQVALAIVAAPDRYVPLPPRPGYNRKRRYPYEVTFTGARPASAPPLPALPTVAGKPHPNGGGFVAETASVAATAYVAPGARVLERAKVDGRARIEDNAVVSGDAKVSGDAVVGGWARVRDRAIVDGAARVRECALVGGDVHLSEYARVREYARLLGKGTVRGDAYIRGFGEIFCAPTTDLAGGVIAGEDLEVYLADNPRKVIDGGLLYGFMDKDILEREKSDNAYKFVHWDFDSPREQVLHDAFGDGEGVLRGAPSFGIDKGSLTLQLNGRDQYALVEGQLADSRTLTIDARLRWDGTGPGQNLLHFFGPGGSLTITPQDEGGGLALTLTVGGRTETVRAAAPLPTGKWVRLTVALGETDGALFVDGTEVARGPLSRHAEDVRAAWGYLGRGFKGSLDDLWILRAAVTPSPAAR